MTATLDERLSALDASFLTVETPNAHMHVGWAARFERPAGRQLPSFEEIRAHIGSRLWMAPRCRQRVAEPPLGLGSPMWIDDDDFDIEHHVQRARDDRPFEKIVDEAISRPLDRSRPLWEIRVAEDLEDGGVGVVGKAHHCMVDGLAMVELASLLVDPTPEPPPALHAGDHWEADPPGLPELANRAARYAVHDGLELGRAYLGLLAHPRRVLELGAQTERALRALLHSAAPAPAGSGLEGESTPSRHLARGRRPLDDLRRIRNAFGGTVNDVVLAAVAGAIHRLSEDRGAPVPPELKVMVPVSVRGPGEDGALGNQISFVFVRLPCQESDPVRRLTSVKRQMDDRKAHGEPQGADAVLRALRFAPGWSSAPPRGSCLARVHSTSWSPTSPVRALPCTCSAAGWPRSTRSCRSPSATRSRWGSRRWTTRPSSASTPTQGCCPRRTCWPAASRSRSTSWRRARTGTPTVAI